MKPNQVIILLRHGKAVKNEQDIHGGNGSDLLGSSFQEVIRVANEIDKLNLSISKILYIDRIQCEQTAKQIGEKLRIIPEPATELPPIHLGVINGLSNNEVAELYPEVMNTISKWRNGEIEINQLDIPEIDNNEIFYQKGTIFIDKVKKNGSSTIIVGTRSVLVLLASILLKRTPKIGGNYREIKWGNTEYFVFSFGKFGTSLHINLSSLII